MSRWTALLVASACLAMSGCGGSGAATPLPAPEVTLSSAEKALWAKLPADRSTIPVLVYHGIGPQSDFSNEADASYGVDVEDFATQMTEIRHAGYQTVDLQTFLDFVGGKAVDLPPRPLLLTFDDGRADSWTGADGILRELHFNAVMFVDVGRVDHRDPEYLTWQRSSRPPRTAAAGSCSCTLARATPRSATVRIPTTRGRTTPMRRGTRTSTPGGNGCDLTSSGARRRSLNTYRPTGRSPSRLRTAATARTARMTSGSRVTFSAG